MALHPRSEVVTGWHSIQLESETIPAWLNDLGEHSRNLLCVHDLEGRFLSVNATAARSLGYTPQEMLRKPMRDFLAPEFADQFELYLQEIREKRECHGFIAVLTRGGEKRIWEYHNTLIADDFSMQVVRGIAHDVTERVRAEQALRASHEQLSETARRQEQLLRELTLFRAQLDQANDGFLVIEPNTLGILDVNQKACSRMGYTREEFLKLTVADIDGEASNRCTDETGVKGLRLLVAEQLKEKGYAILERRARRKDGTTFPVELNLKLVQLDRQYCILVSRDITQRKIAEERLREFERVVENLEDMIVVIDREYRYVIANRAFLKYRQMSPDQVIGRPVAEVLHTGFFESDLKQKMDRCFEGSTVIFELTYNYPDIGNRDLAITYLPIEGPYGIQRIACVLRDVSDQKRAEARLREFERVLENVDEMIVVVDRDYKYVMANRAALHWRGLTQASIDGKSLPGVVTPALYETIKQKIDECFTGKVVSHELRYEYPAVGIRDIWITYSPIEGLTGIERVACVARDVTEQRRAEQALRESERRERARAAELEAVFDAVPFPLYISHDRDCLRLTGNRAAYQQLGVPPGENFSKSACSDNQPKFRILEDGVEVPADLLPMQVAARTGKPVFDRPNTVVLPDGTQRESITNAVPLLGEHGEIRGVVGASVDVTKIKKAEDALRQSEERFRVALKNSPISVFNQDRDLRYTWMYNPTVSDANKYLGKTPFDLFKRQEAERMAEVRRRVLETGIGIRHNVEITDAGKKHFFDTTIEPVLNSSGAVVGLTAASMDVTELREVTEALRVAKGKLAEEKFYLEQEIDTELGFGEIIGQSNALQEVMQQVGKVASSNATVLLLGETGTGKELFARAIHRLSQRHNNSFIKMNCAAIPSGLLESELFGNERGAFTGAISKKIGRLELADKGTLFLDEIGEIDLVLQPKLLRVLQDQEFERLGGNHTIKVDFRLIAATNADLAARVRENDFRSDLFYRLNVFPIRVPPLRERRDDIRFLVEHFVQKFARRMNKSITSVPTKTMEALMSWDWPGNVRELENFVERSVILTHGSVLVAPLNVLQSVETENNEIDQTLQSAEREYILSALRESHGKIGGPRGAAVRLGLKRTTLQSKMKHLGIISPTASAN
jgi:PAS domain S-box-containing protein